ncbi:MAG: hypothetical protein LBE13_03505 [Bacteroidales bacterium]|jgi:RHS repeat-associated protein|nr:hypothetical protein [Bacteroidales bacterium]
MDNDRYYIKEQKDYYPFGKEHQNPNLITSTNRWGFSGKEKQTVRDLGFLDFGARMLETEIGRWFVIDPLAEKYYSVSPYVYCVNNPLKYIDPDGEDIYMYYYVSNNKNEEDDAMFMAAALTRSLDMLKSGQIKDGDAYVFRTISDLGKLKESVESTVEELSPQFGKTAEFGLWSHGSLDGPIGSIPTSVGDIGYNQMSIEEWGNINYNWKTNEGYTKAMFFGCRTAADKDDKGNAVVPWILSISKKSNMKNVNVYGQTHRSWPSIYPDNGTSTSNIRNNIHIPPIYMVGSNKHVLSRLNRLMGWSNYAYPMAIYQNGKFIGTQYQSRTTH